VLLDEDESVPLLVAVVERALGAPTPREAKRLGDGRRSVVECLKEAAALLSGPKTLGPGDSGGRGAARSTEAGPETKLGGPRTIEHPGQQPWDRSQSGNPLEAKVSGKAFSLTHSAMEAALGTKVNQGPARGRYPWPSLLTTAPLSTALNRCRAVTTEGSRRPPKASPPCGTGKDGYLAQLKTIGPVSLI
jgi:hypothetical protein